MTGARAIWLIRSENDGSGVPPPVTEHDSEVTAGWLVGRAEKCRSAGLGRVWTLDSRAHIVCGTWMIHRWPPSGGPPH